MESLGVYLFAGAFCYPVADSDRRMQSERTFICPGQRGLAGQLMNQGD